MNKLIKPLSVFALAVSMLLFAQQATAQKWVAGYVITKVRDTLQGEIKYKESTKFNIAVFKNEKGVIREYLPGEITGYGTADKYFYRDEDVSSNVFIIAMVQDTLSLIETNYLVKPAYNTTSSGYKVKYFIKLEDKAYLPLTRSGFVDDIVIYLADNKALCKKIQNKELGYKSLMAIVREYNEWAHNKKQ